MTQYAYKYLENKITNKTCCKLNNEHIDCWILLESSKLEALMEHIIEIDQISEPPTQGNVLSWFLFVISTLCLPASTHIV